MEAFLIKLLAFLVAVAILVTVHEFGHFWVARKVGVRVLRFSIGFGQPLWRWRGRQATAGGQGEPTEYVIAAIPLGGYVRMLDEREGEVAGGQLDYAFNRKPLWARSAVVAAGPLFNFAFAVVAFWLVAMLGESGVRPLIGAVAPGSPAAQIGVREGDEIVDINGSAARSWSEGLYRLAAANVAGDDVHFGLRDAAGNARTVTLPAGVLGDFAELDDPLQALGVEPRLPSQAAVIGELVPGEAAELAGFRAGDLVLRADGTAVPDWNAWVSHVRERPGRLIRVEVMRDGQIRQLEVIPRTVGEGNAAIGRIGAGVQVEEGLWDDYLVEYRYGPLEAVGRAAAQTWDYSVLTVSVLWRMLVGEASLKNLGGPLTMADAAGTAVTMGVTQFLRLLALISVSLAVLNLLPLPILDGGHLLYFAYEAVAGKPPSDAALERGQRIGLAFLALLMAVVLYQDISRLMG
jgi:regulator of sigma E protease